VRIVVAAKEMKGVRALNPRMRPGAPAREMPDAYQLAPLEDVLRELAEGQWDSMTINQEEARELVALIDRGRNDDPVRGARD
jgi:hypothetical protein